MSGESQAAQPRLENAEEELSNSDEDTGLISKIKKVLPRWTFRRSSRNEEEEEEGEVGSSSQRDSDIEAGPLHARLSGQSLRAENRAIRQTQGACSSSDSAGEGTGGSPTGGSPRQSDPGSGSGQSLLDGLIKLGGAALPRNPSNPLNPTCLICLETLSQEEFANGEAIVLECECRGEVAMRHRACAEKWSQVKGNRSCDICKQTIRNLPDVPPRAPESGTPGGMFDDSELLRNNAQVLVDQTPSGADVVFDCIRVTWIAMIVSILFFGMDIANALWTGAIIGLGYTLFVRAMYRHQLAMLMREQQRERDQGGESPQHTVVHVI